MSDHAVFLLVLGACCCGAAIAVGVVGHLVWLAERAERDDGRWR